jgi:hypothetical protein
VQQLAATTGSDGTASVATPTAQLHVGVNVTIRATTASPSVVGNVRGTSTVADAAHLGVE